MLVNFSKMHGLGNDFIILDQLSYPVRVSPSLIRKLADRHFGIGCDQVLVVEAPLYPENDFFYRIFNANGQEVEHCGNGARCFARYVRDNLLTNKSELRIETISGTIEVSIRDNSCIRVTMGKPEFEAANIPTTAKLDHVGFSQIQLLHRTRPVRILALGNPHCVFRTTNVKDIKVHRIGRSLQQHPAFPKGVNVSFMQTLEKNHIRLRVYERGIGESLACGTAACAAVINGILAKDLDSSETIKVDLPGGQLLVEWPDPTGPVFLSGPASTVFHGQFAVETEEVPLKN